MNGYAIGTSYFISYLKKKKKVGLNLVTFDRGVFSSKNPEVRVLNPQFRRPNGLFIIFY